MKGKASWLRARAAALHRPAPLSPHEAHARAAIEHAPFPIIIYAEDGEVLTLSRTWTEITGYSVADLPTVGAWTSHMDGGERARLPVSRLGLTGEHTVRCHDGSERIWEFSSIALPPLPDGRRAAMSMAVDLTGRKQQEQALRESEQRLRTVLDGLGEAIFAGLMTADGVVLEVNAPSLRRAGLTRNEVIGRPFTRSRLWSDPGVRPRLELAIARAREGETVRYEETACVTGGRRASIDLTLHPLRNGFGDVHYIVLSAVDITERRAAERLLRDTSDRLLLLSRRLLEIQESERRQVARELHDEIGQALTAAKITLQTLQRYPDPSAVDLRLDDGIAVIDRALTQIRSISLELRPPLLDDLGLGAALRWFAEQQQKHTGLSIEFRGATAARYDADLEIACFRVAQEAVNNVVRHARASHAVMTLETGQGMLHLRVRDDGVGFDTATARRRAAGGESLGLVGMEERSMLVGGGIEWSSQAGSTEVHAWFPVGGEESGAQ